MQLRFGISGSPVYDTAVSEGDFVAVYDKKLLWRANLFIDDRYDEGTQTLIQDRTDWNIVNPWNDPDNNVWQMYIDYTDPLNPGNQLNSNGRQIPILPWTHPDVEFTVNGIINFTYVGTINSGVAYSWDNYGWDESSFPTFNSRMSQQAIVLVTEPNANQEQPTIAPEGDWLEYSQESFIPVLGIYNHVDRTDDSPDIIAFDAGLNCTQFVLHAKTYANGPYIEGVVFDENDPAVPNNSFFLVGEQDDLQGVGVHGNIHLLIPGDIIRCGLGDHWAIVQSITFNQIRETTNAGVALIHSATFSRLWAVQKGESLGTLDAIYTHTYLLRPKFE